MRLIVVQICKQKEENTYHSQKNNPSNRPRGEVITNKGGYTKDNLQNSIILDREVLRNSFSANKGGIAKDYYANTNRGAKLSKKISSGSFIREGYGRRTNKRANQVYENSVLSDRQSVQKKAFQSFFERYQQ